MDARHPYDRPSVATLIEALEKAAQDLRMANRWLYQAGSTTDANYCLDRCAAYDRLVIAAKETHK